MTETEIDTEATVRVLFKASGITVPEEYVPTYVALYPMLRGMVDALYEIPEVRYEEPALVYSALPPTAG